MFDPVHSRIRLNLLVAVGWCLFVSDACGQFTTVRNIPPEPNIGNNQSVGSDTQVNLAAGGSIGNFFTAGTPMGSSNIELNVSGGSVGFGAIVYRTTVNLSGGAIHNFFTAYDSDINISGGTVGKDFTAYVESTVSISGGTVGDDAIVEGNVSISGGSFGRNFSAGGGTVMVSGGTFSDSFRVSGTATIFGDEFRSDGVLISGLNAVGDGVFYLQPGTDSLTGTLADGSPFAFAIPDSLRDGPVTLHRAELPPVGPAMITAPSDPVPTGIRGGQTLVIQDGGVVGRNFTAGFGSTVKVIGGDVGDNFEAAGGLVQIEGGTVGQGMDALPGSVVHISGGSVGVGLIVYGGSTVNISGGSVGSGVEALSGSTLAISGGSVAHINAEDGSSVTISGGTHIAEEFQAEEGSIVNLVGTQFTLNGFDFTASLAMNTRWKVTQRDVTLAGVLADGTPFSFDLASVPSQYGGFFDPNGLLTVTRVLPGDFNGDAKVDAADYVVWRRGLGTTYAQAHYDIWRAHFGQTAGSGAVAALSAAVPEPATLALLLMSLGACVHRRARPSAEADGARSRLV